MTIGATDEVRRIDGHFRPRIAPKINAKWRWKAKCRSAGTGINTKAKLGAFQMSEGEASATDVDFFGK